FRYGIPRIDVGQYTDGAGGARLDQRSVDMQLVHLARHRAIIRGIEYHELVAIGIYDVTVTIHAEVACTAVDVGSVVIHDEEARAIDSHVQHVVGVADVALGETLVDPDDGNALARGVTTHAQQA